MTRGSAMFQMNSQTFTHVWVKFIVFVWALKIPSYCPVVSVG